MYYDEMSDIELSYYRELQAESDLQSGYRYSDDSDDDDDLDYEERYDFDRRRSRYNADNENCTFRVLKLLWAQKHKGLLSPSETHDLRLMHKEFYKNKKDMLMQLSDRYSKKRPLFRSLWGKSERENAWNDLKNRSIKEDTRVYIPYGPVIHGCSYNYHNRDRTIFKMILGKMEQYNHKH